jgi:hypothetical protein
MTPLKHCIPFILTATLLLPCSGCSKKKQESSTNVATENQLVNETLLGKLPESTAGFAIFNLTGDGYSRLKASPFARTKNARELFEQIKEKARAGGADEPLLQVAQKIFDASVKLGMVSDDGTYTPERVVQRTILFAGPSRGGEQAPEVGLFARAAQNVDLAQQLLTLQKILTESGMKPTRIPASSGEIISVGADNVPVRVFLGANKEVFGASTSQSTIELLLSDKSTPTLQTLRALPEYQRATSQLTKTDAPLVFGFASVSRFLPLLERAAKHSNNEEINLKELPIEGIAVANNFPKEYSHSIAVAVSPRNESQSKILKALEASALSPKTSDFPSDTAITFAVDPRSLQAADELLQQIQASGNPALAKQLENIRSFAVGIRNNASGAPIPDLLMSIETQNREALQASIESSLSTALSSTGLAAPWQTKDIAGNPTRFFQTLVGAGLYISSPKGTNTLVMGSSELAVKDLAASQSAQSLALVKSLPASARDTLTSANVALVYLNFSRIADVMDSIRNTLAMFTGGNSELNQILNSAQIRSWGSTAAGSVSYKPGALVINSYIDSPPAS